MGDAVLGAEAVHLVAPRGAVTGLERAWPVIKTGVDHAAVVTRLVGRELLFGLEHGQPGAR